MKNLFFTLVIALIAIIDTTSAQITNPKISLQGILREASGVAVEDGEYDITFRLYEGINDALSADIYEEDHEGVQVSNGVYSVQLGTYVSMSALPFDKIYYVGVQVGATELLPRIELTHSPYSMAALSVSCSGAVGDVKYSILDESQFQQANGDCWVPMDGRSVTGTAIEQMFGWTNVPDGSGMFLRAQEWNEGYDPDRTPNSAIAQMQEDTIQAHNHVIEEGGEHQHVYSDWYSQDSDEVYTDPVWTTEDRGNDDDEEEDGDGQDGSRNVRIGVLTENDGAHSHTMLDTGGEETRPTNMNFYIYIRVN